jgi:hypothetical protein
MTVLGNLGLGFYLLLHRWKKDGDRRLAVSAAMTTAFVVNLISLRSVLDAFLASLDIAYDPDVPKLVLVIVIVAVWLAVSRLIVTDRVYSEIRTRSTTDPTRTEARRFALWYLWATLLLFVVALVLAATMCMAASGRYC